MQPASRPRVVAYLRVSTEKQAAEGVSLAAQRAKVEAYASLYELDLVAVLEDAGASAKTLDRPALREALALLDTGAAEGLLVAKLDRLTRSVRDLGELLDSRFGRPNGPALLSVADQIDTRSAAGRLVLNVLASVSQWEREAIGERTAAAMAHKKAQGELVGSVPYGWTLASDGRTLEPCAEEQSMIALARELRETGLSLRKIGAQLEARGLLPRNGRSWAAQSVKGLLAAQVAQ